MDSCACARVYARMWLVYVRVRVSACMYAEANATHTSTGAHETSPAPGLGKCIFFHVCGLERKSELRDDSGPCAHARAHACVLAPAPSPRSDAPLAAPEYAGPAHTRARTARAQKGAPAALRWYLRLAHDGPKNALLVGVARLVQPLHVPLPFLTKFERRRRESKSAPLANSRAAFSVKNKG
eukprot:6196423-Pleurochrysis_carterae.AAC.1